MSRFKRLPDDDPTRRVFANPAKPKLAYRGLEAWLRARADAARDGMPEPEPPDRDVAALTHKPCTRRVGEWVLKEAGIADAPVEPAVICPPDTPMGAAPEPDSFHPRPTREDQTYRPTDETPTRRPARDRRPPGRRHHNLDAAGGGGALIEIHREQRTEEVTAPAGVACSSTAAELVAICAGLDAALTLPAQTFAVHGRISLLTDSKASLQRLSKGRWAQTSRRHLEVWDRLARLSNRGISTTLLWVPGHAGVERNEAADALANQAADTESQATIPLDLMAARSAANRVGRAWTRADSRRHPYPTPTPGHDDLSRRGQVILSQLRVGRSPLTREVLHRIGRAADPWCLNCGEPEIDSTRHLLAECPAYSAARSSLWGGPLPTMASVLGSRGSPLRGDPRDVKNKKRS